MRDVFDYIDEKLEDVWRDRRPGFYAAKVTGVLQSFRRQQLDPAWMDTAFDGIRRISSPILDVIPAVGMRMAVLSEDGVPERAAYIGRLWDDAAQKLTVWLRANLATDPGRLEVGATKSLHIRVGGEDAGAKADESVALEQLADGTVRVEVVSGAWIELRPNGDVVVNPGSGGAILLGEGATQALARADKVEAELASLRTAFNTHTHAVTGSAAAGGAVTGTAAVTTGLAGPIGGTGTNKSKGV